MFLRIPYPPIAVTLMTLLLLASPQARAEEVPYAESTQAVAPKLFDRTEHYGYQPLLVDLTALTLLFLSAKAGTNGSTAVLATAGILYAAGPPAIHIVHGREPGVVVGSLLLRTGAPVAFGGLFFGIAHAGETCSPGEDFCGLGPALMGLLGAGLGVVGAAVIDDAFVSKHRVPNDQTSANASGAAGNYALPFTVAPLVNISREPGQKVTTFGFTGTF